MTTEAEVLPPLDPFALSHDEICKHIIDRHNGAEHLAEKTDDGFLTRMHARLHEQTVAECNHTHADLGEKYAEAMFAKRELTEEDQEKLVALLGRKSVDAALHHVLETLDYDLPCGFDHHGGCQQHGYLDPDRGCPVPVLKGKEIRGLDMAGAREAVQALLDIIEASGNFDAHAGAERMACILLGDNWNEKLDG